MFLDIIYDYEASKIAGKMMFSAQEFVVQPHHIMTRKKEWRLKLIDEDTFPEGVPCQVMLIVERHDQLKCIFFNPDFIIPEECHEEPLLNKSLLERSATNGGLWIEMMIPLAKMNVTMTLEKQ